MAGALRLDIVIPVYNEAHVLERSVTILSDFLHRHLDQYACCVVVADNASTDGTLAVAQRLAAERPEEVACLHLPQKGRGRALRAAWLASTADIMSYMDVDLSTGLEALPALVGAVRDGADLAIGSRLLPASCTIRSPKREFISRCYNIMTKVSHQTRISDMQCGFKAISRTAAHELLPMVQNNEWFFDTELLLLAEKWDYCIAEVPVQWVEDPDSRVKIMKTALEDIRGLLRLRFQPPMRPTRTMAAGYGRQDA